MHQSQTYSSPQTNGRIGSDRLRQTQCFAANFTGLEKGASKYDLLLLVKRVGKTAGFSSRAIELLEYYMAFTTDMDWRETGTPIVYQSLAKASLDLGVSERQIQRLEKQLFELGAITWKDSGNHKRYGKRCPDTGVLLYAFGVDLSPLASLKGALQAKLEEKQQYDAAWLKTKREISHLRRQIKTHLNELTSKSRGEAFSGRYEAIAKPIRTSMDLNAISELLVLHRGLLRDIETVISQKMSRTDDKNVMHIQVTTKNHSDKSDTSRAAPNCFQESRNAPFVAQPESKERNGRSVSAKDQAILQTGLQHISLKQALNAASERFRSYIPMHPRPMNWDDVIEAAYAVKAELHISQRSWANACSHLGKSGAAICVLLTDQGAQREENRVKKPAAYFNGMIGKFEVGELHLHNSIFGLLKSAE